MVETLAPFASASLRHLPTLMLLWLAVLADRGFQQASVGVALVSGALFVGEHLIRRWIFPGEWFPGMVQQIRDTAQVWGPRRGPQR